MAANPWLFSDFVPSCLLRILYCVSISEKKAVSQIGRGRGKRWGGGVVKSDECNFCYLAGVFDGSLDSTIYIACNVMFRYVFLFI